MSDKARTLMSNTIVVDGLFHALMKDPPPECGIGKNIVDMILEGGVNCMVDSIISDQYSSSFNDLLNAIYDYKLLEDVLPSKYTVAESIADIEKAKEEGKLALIMSTQGSDFLQSDLRKISLAYKLGLRIVQVTYNNECSFGCGSYVKHDTGLTHFGEQAIIEMNRVGMVIDVSHVGHVTALQTIEASQDPVIYSHSGVQALTKHVRNTNDEHIKALAKKGGVLCVCPHCIMNTNNQDVRPTVDDYINSFIHIAEVTGSMDHAGMYARLLAFSNGDLQSLYDRSNGFYRRQLILTTKEKPADRVDDPDIAEKMKLEIEGIFLWAFEGLQRLAANNFRFTESPRTLNNREYVKRDANNAIDFMESNGYIRLKADMSVTSKELYAIYGIWCDENGLTPIRQRSFSDFLMRNLKTYNLEHTNTVTNATGRRVWGYLGIEPLINPRISENWGKALCTYVPES